MRAQARASAAPGVPVRPREVVVVAGTATEVGKTWVAAGLLRLARQWGLQVAARKPAQSYEPGAGPLDSEVLGQASGEAPDMVCPPPLTYPCPLAPPMAAEALGWPAPTLAGLVEWVQGSWPDRAVDVAVVESAGGVASPMATDGDCVDLARALGADRVVLVADPALGVINSVRLSLRALAPLPVVVHLNRFDPSDATHRRNVAWLSDPGGIAVTTTLEELAGRLGLVGGGTGAVGTRTAAGRKVGSERLRPAKRR